MNVQLTNAISDVVGETGKKILRAIAADEHYGQALARTCAFTPMMTRSRRAYQATSAPSICSQSRDGRRA